MNSRSSAWLTYGGEEGDVAAADQVLQGLQQGGLLDELSVVGLEEGDEDGVGVDLGGVGWALIIGKCMNNITGFERSCEEEEEEEEEEEFGRENHVHGE